MASLKPRPVDSFAYLSVTVFPINRTPNKVADSGVSCAAVVATEPPRAAKSSTVWSNCPSIFVGPIITAALYRSSTKRGVLDMSTSKLSPQGVAVKKPRSSR